MSEYIVDIQTRLATPADDHIPAYDHTKLSAINTCPAWGIIRYTHHKRMGLIDRELALEAGSASHDAFAAIRLFQLHAFDGASPELVTSTGLRLFGAERFDAIIKVVSVTATDRTNMIGMALEALYSSGYYDDPSDRNRTITNISESLIAYVDRWDNERYPIYTKGDFVGIEIAFNIVVTLTTNLGNVIVFRYVGIIDGVHLDKDEILAMENKTGARIDDAWLAQWQMSHQITGYCLALSTLLQAPCYKAAVLGMKIPVGRDVSSAIRFEKVRRNSRLFKHWANWALHSVNMDLQFRDNVLEAPLYTHSCNRYFRACSFLPLCTVEDDEERKQILEEMVEQEWNPLNH